MTKVFKNALKAVKPNGPIEPGIIPTAYEMSLEDLVGLLRLAVSGTQDAAYEAIIKAFHFGFVMGNRATISRKLKRL